MLHKTLKLGLFLFLYQVCLAEVKFHKNPAYWPDNMAALDSKNSPHNFDHIEAKPMLILFWATWSTSCLQDLIDLDNLKKDFSKLPIDILAVSEDDQGVEKIESFYKKNNVKNLKILHDQKNILFKHLGINTLPHAFFVDTNRKVIFEVLGHAGWATDETRNLILSNLPGNHELPYNSSKDQARYPHQ